ncbi:MAG: response regulator transcription factor [Verrucomicrobiales bacterium]|nr:response regulator transcription factor [Verrucomicrobiales bacterium]
MNDPAASPPPDARVFVVDDDRSCLTSVSRLLRAAGFAVSTFTSATDFLAIAKPDLAGCVVSDLKMPEMDGMALQQALAQAGSNLPIVFLTGHGDIPTTVQAIRRGAEDFLTKNAPGEQLIAAVRRAIARNKEDRAERSRVLALRQPFQRLSTRELEVLRHVVQGKLNKQTAAELGIHERTVKFHRTAITTKLGVQSVPDLIRMVEAAGLFD